MSSLCASCKFSVAGPTPSGRRCEAGAPEGHVLANGGVVTRCGTYSSPEGRRMLTDVGGRIDPARIR